MRVTGNFNVYFPIILYTIYFLSTMCFIVTFAYCCSFTSFAWCPCPIFKRKKFPISSALVLCQTEGFQLASRKGLCRADNESNATAVADDPEEIIGLLQDSESRSHSASDNSSTLGTGQSTDDLFTYDDALRTWNASQKLSKEHAEALEHIPEDATREERFVLKNRRIIGIAIPFVFFMVTWWSLAIRYDLFALFPRRYIMCIVMIFGALIAGNFTAIAGSGVDICSFSILTLLFHVSEKIATPTSVVLMAFNTNVGFYWRQLIQTGVSTVAWEYFAVCVPVVVFCAPFGSLLSSHFHRLVLASMVYVLETIALISGFVIVKPDLVLGLVSASIIVGGFLFFFVLSRIGIRVSRGILNESNGAGLEEPNELNASGPVKLEAVSKKF